MNSAAWWNSAVIFNTKIKPFLNRNCSVELKAVDVHAQYVLFRVIHPLKQMKGEKKDHIQSRHKFKARSGDTWRTLSLSDMCCWVPCISVWPIQIIYLLCVKSMLLRLPGIFHVSQKMDWHHFFFSDADTDTENLTIWLFL